MLNPKLLTHRKYLIAYFGMVQGSNSLSALKVFDCLFWNDSGFKQSLSIESI